MDNLFVHFYKSNMRLSAMFEHQKIQTLADFFLEENKRAANTVYFYRIYSYTEEIEQFIQQYYEAARLCGVVIEGKLPNPDEKNLSYYNEIMGMNFQMDVSFLKQSLQEWLPRIKPYQRELIAVSMYDTLDSLRKAGKNESILKNIYIKFMCWFYYKLERVVNQLGSSKIPKILYEGEISQYELLLFSILSHAGCDIVLLQYYGDASYLKLDPDSLFSDFFSPLQARPFPQNFCLKELRRNVQKMQEQEQLYGKQPDVINCTNAWIEGTGFGDIQKSVSQRGEDSRFFYNVYCRIHGVEDKLTYETQLFQFYLELQQKKRNVVIVQQEITKPSIEEIASIRRQNYTQYHEMLADLSHQIVYQGDIQLQYIARTSFVDVLLEEANKSNILIQKLMNKAVYLLCWWKRYQKELFLDWKLSQISCFIYLGGCKTETEALFLKFLSRLPVDVLILLPNLEERCCLQDKLLYEIHHTNTLVLQQYPQGNTMLQMRTAAYQAERELDTILYQDSGFYRNQQYTKATALTLKTTYEEIRILWKEEVKYRPNFSVVGETVNIPVIFAKVSGVRNRLIGAYWSEIKELLTDHTILIQNTPYIEKNAKNPIKPFVTEFYKRGKLQKEKIKAHSSYAYGFLREEIQEYMLDKLQYLIEQNSIKGVFENGTEYTIVAVALHLQKEWLRKIQNFDFTKKNPKVVYVHTEEKKVTLEDAILLAYLNVLGFDIVLFVPTGYQTIEPYFRGKVIEEHQLGEYMYDLQLPDWNRTSSDDKSSWLDKFFRRS